MTPAAQAARDSLPEDLRHVFDYLLSDYRLMAREQHGAAFVSPTVIARLVALGWRISGEPLSPKRRAAFERAIVCVPTGRARSARTERVAKLQGRQEGNCEACGRKLRPFADRGSPRCAPCRAGVTIPGIGTPNR